MASLNLVAWIQRLAARIEQLERGVAFGNGTISNAKLTSMAEARIKGRAAGSGTGAPVDLTGTQATAILDVMVGDSGSGGTKGLVPAPASGDAAAGRFLKADGTFAVPPGTGGSGNDTQTTAVGSEGAASSGDLDFYTNGFGIGRYSGSAWPLWGPAFAFTAPVSGDFAWINQGSASISTTNGGIVLVGTATAGPELRIRKKAAPSTPYTITVAMIPAVLAVNYTSVGLVVRESGSGKAETFGVSGAASGLPFLAVDQWTNASTYSSTPTTVAPLFAGPVVWLRFTDDGSNRIYSVSFNGQTFMQIHSVGRTSFLTGDEVGFFVKDQQATYVTHTTLLSWRES